MVLVIPFFFRIHLDGSLARAAAVLLLLALAVYYAAWSRYFVGGRRLSALYQPLLGLRVPLAVAPTMYFVAAAALLGAPALLIAGAALGLSHIPLTLHAAHRHLRGAT